MTLVAITATTGGSIGLAQAAWDPFPPPPGSFFAEAELDGNEVVPGPGDPDARGDFGVDPFATRGRICYGLEVKGLDTITGAYIHKGERREAGPARLTLFEETVGRPGTGYYHGCINGIRKRLVRHMVGPSEGRGWPWYVEVRTVAYPAGAIRGQFGMGKAILNLRRG